MAGNVFSEFLIKFDIAGNASKGIKNLNNDIDSTGKKTNKVSQFMSSLRKDIGITSFAFGGAVFAVSKLIESTSQASANIISLSREAGIGTTALQQMSNAYAGIANISTEQAQSDISKLGKQLQDFRMGLADPAPFAMAGVEITSKTSTSDVVSQLRNNLSKLDDAKATAILSKLNLSKDFLFLIKSSSQEIQRFSQIEVLSKEQLDNTMKMGTALRTLKLQFLALKNKAIADIAPSLTASLGEFFDLITKNKDRIVSFLGNVVNYLKDFILVITRTVRLLTTMLNAIFRTDKGFELLALAIGGVFVAISPMLRVFTLFALVFEDIQAYLEGAPSLFGEIISAIKPFIDIFSNLPNIIKKGIEAISSFLGMLKENTLNIFSNAIENISTKIATLMSPIIEFINLIKSIGNLEIKNPFAKFTNKFNNKEAQNQQTQTNNTSNATLGAENDKLQPVLQPARQSQMTSIIKTERELTGADNSNKVFQPVYNFNVSGTNGEQIATDILGIMRKENQKNFNETAFLLN